MAFFNKVTPQNKKMSLLPYVSTQFVTLLMAGGAGSCSCLGRTWADSLRRLNRPAVLAINRNGASPAFDRRALCRQSNNGSAAQQPDESSRVVS